MDYLNKNILIAEFMGGKYNDQLLFRVEKNIIWLPIFGQCRFDTIGLGSGPILEYHKSWDWLMTVSEKINSLKLGDITIQTPEFGDDKYFDVECNVIISNCYCSIELYSRMKLYSNFIQSEKAETTMQAVYNVVLKFIKWYNEQN